MSKLIAGEIVDSAMKDGANGRYAEIKVLPQGKSLDRGDRPFTIRAFDPKLVERFEKAARFGKGLAMGFIIEEQPVGDGRPGVYRNLVGLTTVAAAQDTQGQPEEAEPFPVATATPASGKSPPAPNTPSAPQPRDKATSSPSDTQKSISTQKPEPGPGEWYDTLECPPLHLTADKYAGVNERYIQWHFDRRSALDKAAACCPNGEPQTVIGVADQFFRWLRGITDGP